MPGFFSPMGAFGRAMVPMGSAAGTAYRGFQDYQHRQLDDQLARQRQQLEMQRFQLDQQREKMQESEYGHDIWQDQQAQLQDKQQRQALSEMLSGMAKDPKLDPAQKLNYQAGAAALAAGAPWNAVSAALGFEAKNALAVARAAQATAGAGMSREKGEYFHEGARLMKESGSGDGGDTGGGEDYSGYADGTYKDTDTGETVVIKGGVRVR